MRLKLPTAVALALGAAFASAMPAFAADLPESGSFKLHSGWKGVGETVQVEKDHVIGAGHSYGVTFNDAGAGPLHNGTVVCAYEFELVNGASTGHGPCAWSDSAGDKIFTYHTTKSGSSSALSGVHQVTGGTGKFKGIQGKAEFQCTYNDKSQLACTQQFSYSLAK
jgi:hypothetical protein